MRITTKHIQVLQEVKEHLLLNKNFYICHAIEDIADEDSSLYLECYDLKDWVLRQLGKHYAYGSWLVSSYPWHVWTDEQERSGRIAWVEHMIKILQHEIKKGSLVESN